MLGERISDQVAFLLEQVMFPVDYNARCRLLTTDEQTEDTH
jgi:hypothetical protein